MWKWTGSGSSAWLPVFLISRLMASVVNGVRRSVVEHVAVVGERLAQRRQHPQLISGEHWPCRPWPAGHAARPIAQLHLRPFQLAGLLGAQAVTVGHKDQGGVPMPPAARLRRLEQLLDLVRTIGSLRARTTPRQRSAPRWVICCEVLPAAPAVISCRRSLRSCARSRAGWPEQGNPLDDGMPGG